MGRSIKNLALDSEEKNLNLLGHQISWFSFDSNWPKYTKE